MDSASAVEEWCDNCYTGPGTQPCNGCKGARGPNGEGEMRIFYCSTKCQKEYFQYHATECAAAKNRRSLYRAGGLAQKIFYRIRERFFTGHIGNVEEDDEGNVVLKSYQLSTEKFHAVPFDSIDCKDRLNSVLAWLMCRGVLAQLDGLLRALLKDLYTDCNEHSLSSKNAKLAIVNYHMDINLGPDINTRYNHEIIKITLKNEEAYAIDITGAQYGYPEPVAPWDIYFRTRVDCIDHIHDLGFHRKSAAWIDEKAISGKAVKDVNEEIAIIVEDAVLEWEKLNMKLSLLLRKGEVEFTWKQEELISNIMQEVEKRRDHLEEAGRMELAARQSLHDYAESAKWNSAFIKKGGAGGY